MDSQDKMRYSVNSDEGLEKPRRCLALIIVQLLGTCLAMWVAIDLELYTTISQPDRLWIGKGLILLLALNLAPLPFHHRYCYEIFKPFTSCNPPRWCVLRFSHFLFFYAVLDIAFGTFFIKKTGGTLQSLFTPLLLSVVPVMITLRTEHQWAVLLFAIITSGVLFYAITPWDSTFRPLCVVGIPVAGYQIWYWLTTSFCFLFPAIAYFIAKPEMQKNKESAS